MDEPDKPEDRNMEKEGVKTLEAIAATAPKEYALEAQWRPKYAQLNADILQDVLPSYIELYKDKLLPSVTEMQNSANTTLRKNQIADIENLGKSAVSAIKSIDPEQAALMDKLNAQAREELDAGGNLSARESYAAAQAARSAGAARGNTMGNSTVFNEFLNNENLRNDREDRARKFASGVSQMNANYYSAPALNALSENSSVANMDLSSILANASSNSQVSSGMFNPYSSYASSLYGQNYATNYDYYLQNRDLNENLIGGILGTAGAAVGGVFGGPAGAAIGGSVGQSTGSTIGSFI